MYGNLNWFDGTAAACGEMVFDVLTGLGAPLTAPIAIHLYIAILTDTGSFHHSNITGRTFGICQELVRAGVRPAEVAACVYQNSSVGKLRLTGTLLDSMELVGDGRIAILNLDDHILTKTGCAPDDLEGLINMPLSAQPIEAVVMFKAVDGHLRISLRSKGDVDVRAVAVNHGGGGHVNAAGFSIAAPADATRATVVAEVVSAVDAAERPRAGAKRTAPAS
jgi:phosphoesterase RecJ-like protein